MHAWLMESYPVGDRRLPHHRYPPKFLSNDQLNEITGVVYYKVGIRWKLFSKERMPLGEPRRHTLNGTASEDRAGRTRRHSQRRARYRQGYALPGIEGTHFYAVPECESILMMRLSLTI